MNLGDRIRITDTRLGYGRTGTIKRVTTAGYEPLYTIRLDIAAYPGGARIPDHNATRQDEGKISSVEGWRVELRSHEFEAI